MIGSILVSLSTKEEVVLKGLGGEALHGLFFEVLKGKSEAIASKLHNLKAEKPFSLSPPLEENELKQGYSFIPQGERITFKVTLLDEELLADAISAFFTAMLEGRILKLSEKSVVVEKVDVREGKFVSFTSFTKILSEVDLQEKITLEFLTPTSFRVNEMQSLFPEPRLVLSSLLKRWNVFSKTKLADEVSEIFPLIQVSNYSLRTELVNFSKYKIIGFKGRIEYRLPQKSPGTLLQATNALADFAFYAGVGTKTTMGMGQTRRIK
ncbi:CRISPR-associated endoribonuclease Cas6 [Dehalococcoidales bacterium]|nr:CRISPR-associated endoribonuclease Cas6 [Dehalococcoidales bacterium]